jgi:hypothetical protein
MGMALKLPVLCCPVSALLRGPAAGAFCLLLAPASAQFAVSRAGLASCGGSGWLATGAAAACVVAAVLVPAGLRCSPLGCLSL